MCGSSVFVETVALPGRRLYGRQVYKVLSMDSFTEAPTTVIDSTFDGSTEVEEEEDGESVD